MGEMNTGLVCYGHLLGNYFSEFFKFFGWMELHILTNDFLTLVLADQDSVRLLAVEGCAALGKLLEPQDCVAHILPVIVNFSQVC